MAERRMFSNTIIDSDLFMDLPLTAQALYFHLAMRADDDGFIGNSKKLCRMLGVGEDDLALLIEKELLIKFDSGVVAVKHWKVNNLIKNDRYKATIYQEEKSFLEVENNTYRKCEKKPRRAPQKDEKASLEPKWNPSGTHLEPQVRLGKDSIGKVSQGKDRIVEVRGDWGDEPPQEPPTEKREAVAYQEIVDAYNNTCRSLPRVTSLSEARRKAIRARLKTYTPADLKRVFIKAEQSSFLKGANDRNWSANFDWLLKDSNIAKVLDGNYDNIRAPASQRIQGGSRTAQQLDASYDMIARWAGGAEGGT